MALAGDIYAKQGSIADAFNEWALSRTGHMGLPVFGKYSKYIEPMHNYDYFGAFMDELQSGRDVYDPKTQHFLARHKTFRHPSYYTRYYR